MLVFIERFYFTSNLKINCVYRLDSRGSIASSNAPTNLNSNWVETSKLEKTLRGLNMVNKATSILDTFVTTIKELVNNLIQCRYCTIFLFDHVLSDKMNEDGNIDRSHIQKIIVEGRYIDSIGLSDSEMSEPCFKTTEELRYGIRNNLNLAFPVMNKHEHIVMAIQLEAKRNKKNNKPMGFAMVDEHIVKTFCHYIHMKIERMLAKKEAQVRERNVVDTLQLTSDICTQRTHKGLIIKMKNKLPKFMNFEAAGILIYDKKTDKLFSVSDEDKGEDEDAESNTIIKFPSTLGISGMVFQNQDM